MAEKATPRISSAGRVRANNGRTSGFTLIELIVVLVILALAGAIAVPRFSDSLDFLFDRSGLRGAAAMMRRARAEAVFRRENMNVTVDSENGKLTLSSAEDLEEEDERDTDTGKTESGSEKAAFRPIEMQIPKTLKIDEVTVDAYGEAEEGKYTFTFYARGTSSGGEIRFEDARRNAHLVRVSPLNGKVWLLDLDEKD